MRVSGLLLFLMFISVKEVCLMRVSGLLLCLMFISVKDVFLMYISGLSLFLMFISGMDVAIVCLKKVSGRHLFEHLMFTISSEWKLILLFWIHWL